MNTLSSRSRTKRNKISGSLIPRYTDEAHIYKAAVENGNTGREIGQPYRVAPTLYELFSRLG